MNPETTWVGIDISKASLDVHLLPQGTAIRVDNSESGIESLVKRLAPLKLELVVMEATGGLERVAHRQLTQAGIPVAIVNPRKVKAFSTVMGNAKTDALDAKLLAEYAQRMRPPVIPVPEASSQQLSELVSRRRQ